MPKVHEFNVISGLAPDTKIPTGQRTGAEPPEDGHFTPAMMEQYLADNGWVKISGSQSHNSDASAAADNVSVGEWYLVGIGHEEGAIDGSLKKRVV